MRLRTTHRATLMGERKVGEDSLGTDQVVDDAPLAEVDGRYRPQGEGLTREERSQRVDASPTLVVRPVGDDPQTGDTVQIMDVAAPGQQVDIDGVDATLDLMNVKPHYGRRSRPDRITLELQRTDG